METSNLRCSRRLAAALLLAVLAPGPSHGTAMASFVHVATAENELFVFGAGNWSVLDHPAVNGDPDARVFVTHVRNDELMIGADNDKIVAPRYADFVEDGRWVLENVDDSDVDLGAAFHVLALDESSASFVHLNFDGNLSGLVSYIECPAELNCFFGSEATDFLASNIATALGLEGALLEVPFSVRQPTVDSSPALRAEDGFFADMKPGALFWILVSGLEFGGARSIPHVASMATITDRATLVEHPLLDGRPRATPQVVKRTIAGSRLPSKIGVYYFPGNQRWYVFHQDSAPMAVGEEFTLFVPPLYSNDFESGTTDWWR